MPQKLRSIKTPKPAEPRQSKPAVTRELTAQQALAIDMAEDMIMNGGRREDVDGLIRSLLQHQWSMRFGSPVETGCGAEWAKRSEGEWYTQLAKGWPDKRPLTLPAATPSVTGQTRAMVRERLRDHMQEFLAEASPEETAFALDVFESRECRAMIADGDDIQYIPLAEGFDYILTSRSENFIRVPEKMAPLIAQLVAARQKIEGKEECA
jgi:hypothetical protein